MIFSLFLVFLAVLLTGISQVLLKIGSAHRGKRKDSVLDAYLNFHTIAAYGLLFLVTVISVIALKEIQLKVFYAIASLGFVVVVVLSWGVLKEEINSKRVAGIFLIICGIIVFNLQF
jgi:multidrug transporter EmrE-like cation transporter